MNIEEIPIYKPPLVTSNFPPKNPPTPNSLQYPFEKNVPCK